METAVFHRLAAAYEPLACRMIKARTPGKTLVAGISGPQGSGKTTAAEVLSHLLSSRGLCVAVLSLDDLYLPWETRRVYNATQAGNPYYRINRGMPGTHDVNLGCTVIKALTSAGPGDTTLLPLFDKSCHDGKGDLLPTDRWRPFSGRPDVLLFEGWMVGFTPLPRPHLEEAARRFPPLADFNRTHDPAGDFGFLVNGRLAAYQPLWDLIDWLVYLKIPGLHKVLEWRELQESRLRQERGTGMSTDEVRAFVEPYLLFTAAQGLMTLGDLAHSPAKAVVMLGEDHYPAELRFPGR